MRLNPLIIVILLLASVALGPSAGAAPSHDQSIISGTVTGENGRPAVGYIVTCSSTDYVSPTPSGMVATDAGGHYTILLDTKRAPGLFPASDSAKLAPDTHFSVHIQIADDLYLEPPNRVATVTPGRTTNGVDFVVTRGPQITVRVHDAFTGQPIPGVSVVNNNYGMAGTGTSLAVTDVRGVAVFRITSLSADLRLAPPGGQNPTVQPAGGSEFYNQVSLQESQNVVWDVKTYPVPAPSAVPWHGVVLQPNGRPAARATVQILRPNGGATVQSDNLGRFVALLPPAGANEYGGLLYADVTVLADLGDESAVLVPTADATRTGMVLRLAKVAKSELTGTVVDAQGRPEAGVPVSCWDTPPNAIMGLNHAAENAGLTDAAGRFTITGLLPGNCRLSLGGGPFGPTTFPPDPANWDNTYKLAAGHQDDLGRIVVPITDQTLAGRIVTDDGRFVKAAGRPDHLGDMWIDVRSPHGFERMDVDPDGRFRFTHLVAELQTLTVTAFVPYGKNSFTSKELAHAVIQAGRQDARIVVPAADLPPEAISPVHAIK